MNLVQATQLKIGDLWLMETTQQLHVLVGIMRKEPGAARLYWLNLHTQRLHSAFYPDSFSINIVSK